MSRRSFVLLFIVFFVPLLVSAQESTPEATVEYSLDPWVCPEGFEGQQLNVFNWSTYIAETTIPQFEEACGVTVQYDNYASNDEMYSKLQLAQTFWQECVRAILVTMLCSQAATFCR